MAYSSSAPSPIAKLFTLHTASNTMECSRVQHLRRGQAGEGGEAHRHQTPSLKNSVKRSATCHLTSITYELCFLLSLSASRTTRFIFSWIVTSISGACPSQPLTVVADPKKVQALAESISEIGLQEPVSASAQEFSSILAPALLCTLAVCVATFLHTYHDHVMQIDVLDVEGQLYGFSGCHRYEVRTFAASALCSTGFQPPKMRGTSWHSCIPAAARPNVVPHHTAVGPQSWYRASKMLCRLTRSWERRQSGVAYARGARQP